MVEEKNEKESNIFIIFFYALLGGIIGGILGYLLKHNFLYIILGFFLGLVFGLFFYGLSFLPKEQRGVVYLLLILLLIFILFFLFFSKITNFTFTFFSSFKNGFKNLFSWFSCLSGSENCPAFGFEEKSVNLPDFSLDINYENDYIKDEIIDMLIKMEITNRKIENLTFYPYCDIVDWYEKEKEKRIPLVVYDLQQYGKVDYFIFPKSDTKLSTSFRCKGRARYGKEDLIIGFNVPYSSQLTWIIYTSSSFKQIPDKKGKIITSESPFDIIIDFPSDMPLENKKYEFFIKLRENPSYKLNLKKINFFEITSTPDTDITCEDFGNKFENYNEEKLKEYYNKDKKEYIFNCKIIISNAPDIVEQRIINIKLNYIVYKELKKTVREL